MQLTPVASEDLNRLLESRDKALPGVCLGVVNSTGQVQYLKSSGPRAIGSSEPLPTDAVFWIASCTKLVTAMACCQLIEQGKLQLDMKVGALLPELSEPEVIQESTPSSLKTEKAKNAITLRQLLTHTAGFGYHWYSNKLKHWVQQHKMDEFNGHSLPMPLIEEPGTAWNYGINIDFVGMIVERVSGLKLGDYFEQHIFKPLGITEATFDIQSRPDMLKRLVPMHRFNPDTNAYSLNSGGTPLADRPSLHSGGAGLFTTAGEYMKLLVPLINQGMGGTGARILKPETVDMMFEDHLAAQGVTKGVTEPSDKSEESWCLSPQHLSKMGLPASWGISFALSKEPYPSGRPAGTSEWGGLANLAWYAARGKAAYIIFHQILPYSDPGFNTICQDAELLIWNGLE